jgi:HlyD family secretion protein
LVWVFGALIVIALAFALRPGSVPVDLAVVERGLLRVTIDEEGETRVRDRFVVSAPVAGRVLRIDLEPGDAVTAGKTVLASFQPGLPALLDARTRAEAEGRVNVARAALEEARAARDRAQTERDFAESDLKRQRELDRAGLVSAEKLEAAVADARAKADALRVAESAIRRAQRGLEVAQAALVVAGSASTASPILIRAPVTGVVLKRLRESESVVPAGEPLLEIGDPKNLEVVSDLLSTDAVRISTGNSVLIEGWGGEKTLKGKVRRIEPSGFTKISALGVEEQRVNAIVDLLTPAEQRTTLGDGFRVEAHIVLWEQPKVLKAPMSALFREGEAWVTYVVDGGRATKRTLRVGRQNGMEAEILDGLRPGDTVIIHPSDAVQERSRVTARR